ncbi:MAG: hypothetical protein IBX64_04250 [Actinobacteria bacterium]|nr:hypothetical protein [Actinomycetota bacterium]
MADMIRRTLLLSIGAISLTAERAQELVNDLVERGEITREQGVSMVRELISRGTEVRKQLRDVVKAEVKKAIDEANIASKSDLKKVEAKIDRLILMQGQRVEGEEAGEASSEVL